MYWLCCRKSLLVPFGLSLLPWQFLGRLSLHLTFSAAAIAGTILTEYGAPLQSQRLSTRDYLCKMTRILLAPPAALVAQFSHSAAMSPLLTCHYTFDHCGKGSVSPSLLSLLTIAIKPKQVHH